MSDYKKQDLRFSDQKIVTVNLEREMKKSFIDYAMSVIVSRALPDARDGLKPVHRRILYAMYEDKLTFDKPYRKSATTVGNVLGRYHPHGDASVYDAMVRLAQDFSMRYMLIDGHGNFGSVDGDPPAAYRYTEARMSRLANEMLTDIDKETVDYQPNFDDKMQEPTVLPSRFPNLLVNGAMGIAVGMATNIPPHNLGEIIDAVCYLIDHPEASTDDLCQIVKGPDFPTGALILGKSGIRAAYHTGKGKIQVRSKCEIEEWTNGRYRIIVTEIPYMVNKARLIEHISELHRDKRIEGITDLRDESDREGMRIVIELRRDVNAQVVLNQLFQYTDLQTTFSVNMLALVNNQPKILTLREMLDTYLDHQFKVVTRRTEYDLKKARERAHILEGLKIACDNIDEVIHIIRTSYDDAKARLMERFGLSEIQAQSILDMRLGRLQGLEVEKIQNELDALLKKIDEYIEILSDPKFIYDIIKTEITEIKTKFADERRTEISFVENDLDIEDLIEEEQSVFTLTNLGYIKRVPATTYRAQRRGGRGVTGMTTREEDMTKTVFTASTHDYLLFFTNFGRIFKLKGYHVPESSRNAKGTNLVNLLQLDSGESVSAMINVPDFVPDRYVFFATKKGIVKRIALDALNTARKGGIRCIGIDEDDEVIGVRLTTGSDKILLAARSGRMIRFDENEVRPMGREAYGVRGIKLNDDDYVVDVACDSDGAHVLTVTDNGYGKITPTDDYTEHHRGSSGVTGHAVTEKTGPVKAIMCVNGDEDVMMIASNGVIIRTGVEDIRVCGRASQGVRLMRLADDVKIISITRALKEDEEEASENTAEAEVTAVEE
ncbi:MAG: DNA gyrase subunit A [Clostridia bacterium]|nr:DNA gyrase subunit A [Clostridia bacterium]MBR5266189.1 DNA gyrase subunit A [Clostridia bacterium]